MKQAYRSDPRCARVVKIGLRISIGDHIDAAMRAIVQRVSRAEVMVEGRPIGKIGRGFVILIGVGRGDNEKDAEFIADRILGLRVFADAAGKMNLALAAVDGELLVISQFTLHADTSQRRPSFTQAAPPDEARRLYEHFLSIVKQRSGKVKEGEFGAHMEVNLVNDGPVTIMLDSRNG
ncbi:MAG TPA: D-aminoacyl-tRNA deacylase [Candidatus Binataceae bacterium]|nr:D-aminoacyl-tRNA deacylase [Candidatus Binataceae bacterium]